MEYLIRLVQAHESFRKSEIEAIAELSGLDLEIISYAEDVRIINHILYHNMPS